MVDCEPSSDRLDHLKATIAKLATAQLHSVVTLASMVSKLNVILLKLHIPITNQHFPSTSSEQSPPPASAFHANHATKPHSLVGSASYACSLSPRS